MKTAEAIREMMFKELPKAIREDEVQSLIEKAALDGEFELRLKQKDFGGDVEILSKFLNTLGYRWSIEFFHGHEREARILVIEW